MENKNLHVSLSQSTDRFAAVAQFNDIQQIKTQIVAEVSVLKRVIADRQRAWDSSAALLSERVAVLERQLQTSRHEASLDPLTQIANRRTFDQTLREWMSPGRPGIRAGGARHRRLQVDQRRAGSRPGRSGAGRAGADAQGVGQVAGSGRTTGRRRVRAADLGAVAAPGGISAQDGDFGAGLDAFPRHCRLVVHADGQRRRGGVLGRRHRRPA